MFTSFKLNDEDLGFYQKFFGKGTDNKIYNINFHSLTSVNWLRNRYKLYFIITWTFRKKEFIGQINQSLYSVRN